MCKQQSVEGENSRGRITKVGFDATRRSISGEITDVDDEYSEDILARLVEASLLLTFAF